MAVLRFKKSFNVDPLSTFGDVGNELLVMNSDHSVSIFVLGDLTLVGQKLYPNVRVLDATILRGMVCVISESHNTLFIEAFHPPNYSKSTKWQLSVRPSDRVNRLYTAGQFLIATGAHAKISTAMDLNRNQNVAISQVASISTLSTNEVGVVTDIYGTGGVLKIYRSGQSLELEEIAEISSRAMLLAKRSGNRLFLMTTNDVQLFVSEIDVERRQLVSEKEICGVECLYLNQRFKLLGGTEQFFAYPTNDYSGLAVVDFSKKDGDTKLDFDLKAYDAACYDFEGHSYVCVVNDNGAGKLFESEEKELKTGCKVGLDFASLDGLELSNATTKADQQQVSRLKRLGGNIKG